MHKQIIAIVFASLILSFSAEASYTTTEVGCITPSEYDEIEKLGSNLTDQVTSNDLIKSMNGDQVEPTETTLLFRSWGRLTRRYRGTWPSS